MTGGWTWVGVAVAGGLGATARYLGDALLSRLIPARFPWGTLAVNVSGSLLAGVVTGLGLAGNLGVDVEVVVAGGFLGAYTTFSTAMFQAMAQLHDGRRLAAIGNLGGTLLLSVGAAVLGVAAVR